MRRRLYPLSLDFARRSGSPAGLEECRHWYRQPEGTAIAQLRDHQAQTASFFLHVDGTHLQPSSDQREALPGHIAPHQPTYVGSLDELATDNLESWRMGKQPTQAASVHVSGGQDPHSAPFQEMNNRGVARRIAVTNRGRFSIGIIGLGMMGRSLAQTCLAEPRVDLVAGCDVDEGARAAWSTAYGVSATAMYADYIAMFERERLDVVIVATHAPHHHAQTLAAAARGINVFCEKPLAVSPREADEMVAACDAHNVKLAVNHIKRGSLGNDIARRLIADGVIGSPYLFRGEGKGGRWAGSELMEMGTHIFDWLRVLAGDPEWIFANVVQAGRSATATDIVSSLDLPYSERDCGPVLGERAFCSLGLPGGMHADIGFLSQGSGDDVGYGFDIVGTEGTLTLRRSTGTDIFMQLGKHRGPQGASPWKPVVVDELAGLDPPVTIGGVEGERLALQRRLLADFLAAIDEGREPTSSGRDGQKALELSMAVWESHLVGRPLTLPLREREHPLERRRAVSKATD